MNFSGLPDNYKAGTRGRAPDSTSNNIFGQHHADGTVNNNVHVNDSPQRRAPASREQQAANESAHDRVNNDARANRLRSQQPSNIFGETTADDFKRDNPYANPQQFNQMQQAHQRQNGHNNGHNNVVQTNQSRHQSNIFEESPPRQQVMNQKRRGFNPITGKLMKLV